MESLGFWKHMAWFFNWGNTQLCLGPHLSCQVPRNKQCIQLQKSNLESIDSVHNFGK